ncbi:Reticulon-4-interacting protein 1, mitochondrial [Trichoplax sp. H2]|nr:Reticulon-4-interacting protein 1, mitochondrial [Trichoplax sp. H2]|eukprot:RDD42315.1 Reticulon-4-interacting protein 1, mitochondrial [Trichoplax sp. H2]
MARIITKLPKSMRAWQISSFGDNSVLQLNENANVPSISRPDQLIIKVRACSMNPVDILMRQGYANKLIHANYGKQGIWPLTLGRDFSGEIVDIGRSVRRFKIGDQVWGTCQPFGPGSHAEYTAALQHEVASKPNSLSHIQASSLPHVTVTTYAALANRAGLNATNTMGKRVLILGGSGGVGTIAVQLIKCWGGTVVTTCSNDAVELMKSLNADKIIDYHSEDAWNEMKEHGLYDVIFDTVGGKNEKHALPLVNSKGTYVSIQTPIVKKMDKRGIAAGAAISGVEFVKKALFQNLKRDSCYSWAIGFGNGLALEDVTSLIDNGKIKPIIKRVFNFNEVQDAYEYLESGHARGKIVIDQSGD